MSVLAITFLLTLAMSFGILHLAMRPASNKTTERRLTVIRSSVNSKQASDSDQLTMTERGALAVRFGKLLDRYRFAKQLKTLLLHADSSMSVSAVVLTCGGAGIGCGLVCYLLLRSIVGAVIAMAAGGLVPHILLRMKRGRRLNAFNTALPEAIDMMARALRAGHAMGTAIELIAEQSPEPLGGEFAQVHQQQRLGLPYRDALLQMGARMPSRDLQFLITAILVQKESGGDLTEILDRASHVIRERIRIQGEVRTKTAQGRLTGWILASLPVIMLLLINIVSPGYSSMLFHDPTGQKMLYVGAGLIAIGGLVIRKVVDVQV